MKKPLKKIQPRRSRTLLAKKSIEPSRATSRPKHICIVTPHLIDHGPLYETAGAVTALARNLSAAGNRVTLLFVPEFNTIDEGGITHLKNHFYDNHLVELEVLLEARDLLPALTYPQKKSVAVYYHIKDKPYDGVYFALEGGLAYYPLLAKETGFFSPRPEMVVLAQSPQLWLSEADRFFLNSVDQLSIHHMEKMSMAWADRVVFLSDTVKAWIGNKQWQVAKNNEVICAPLPLEWTINRRNVFPQAAGKAAPREIALLSLWNFRDGLTLACDMLDKLAQDADPDLTITGFGWFGQILGEHTGGMLVRRARQWPFKLKLYPHTSIRQIIEYCASANCLAVIPAWDSASGFWIAACLEAGIPFVTTDVGANSERVPGKLRKLRTAPADPRALAATVKRALGETGRIDWDGQDDELKQRWARHAAKMTRKAMPVATSRKTEPLVSIVCVHYERPQYLLQAIDAIEHQTYSNIEVILVDDGSRRQDSRAVLKDLKVRFKDRGWKIIEQENKYLGAARNAGIKASKGDFVLFVDDDNALFRDAVRQFVMAMETSGADICTAFHKVFYDETIPLSERLNKVHYLPLGGSVDLGLVQDSFGDANAMVRRSVFAKIGLQNDEYGFTANDWEFFARAELAGLKVRVIPEALYWYRSGSQGMYRTSHWYKNRLPVIETYRKAGFKGLDLFYHLAIAAFSPESEINGLRENLRHSESDKRYLKLAEMDANATPAIELLSEIAAAEGRADTALILLGAVRHPAFRYTAEDRLSTEPLRGDGYKELSSGTYVTKVLAADDLKRFEASVSGSLDDIPLNYLEEPDKYLLQSKEGKTSYAVLAACCPEGTLAASLVVSMDQELAAPSDIMLMLVPLSKDPRLALEAASEAESPGASGWIPVTRGYTEVTITATLASASLAPCSLVVAVRSRSGTRATVLACFSNFRITVPALDRMQRRPRLGPPPSKQRSRRLWPEEYQQARLLTNYPSTLPALMFAPDKGGVFLRPSEHGPVIAIMNGALPAFARGMLARVEIAHEDSSPFEFAMALCEPSSTVTWVDGQPTQYQAFSGWVRVDECFKLVDVEARVERLSRQKLDVLIAIRLPPGSSPSPANSFWRQFIMLWDE